MAKQIRVVDLGSQQNLGLKFVPLVTVKTFDCRVSLFSFHVSYGLMSMNYLASSWWTPSQYCSRRQLLRLDSVSKALFQFSFE